MKIIVGHSNMDLDSIGSMVLARYLFPDHQLVASRQIHPVARHLYNLYRERLDFLPVAQLAGQRIERVVVVDTRVRKRVEEYLQHLGELPDDILVFDHHADDTSDIPGAVIREKAVGANTTLLGLELLRRSVTLHPDDATVALTGIYADTGNFTHENVEYADFQVASLCLQHGASLPLVRQFLRPLAEGRQLALFHEALNHLTARSYGGHLVQLCFLELERQSAGLAAVVEQVFEVEGPDALFAVFSIPAESQSLLIARSRGRDIDLLQALAAFGAAGPRPGRLRPAQGTLGASGAGGAGRSLEQGAPAGPDCRQDHAPRFPGPARGHEPAGGGRGAGKGRLHGSPSSRPGRRAGGLPEPGGHHEGPPGRADEGAGPGLHDPQPGQRFTTYPPAGAR